MSLDIYLNTPDEQVFSINITHNLGKMAREAGLYPYLWEASGWKAKNLIVNLEIGLTELVRHKSKYEQFNPENGWGSWEVLVIATAELLQACRDNPEATVNTWR